MTAERELTDAEIAAMEAPPFWKRYGLHGPVIVAKWIGVNAKRIAIFVAGSAVVLAGVAMLVLPGPGIVVIIAGLAILATEFVWAERALDAAKEKAGRASSAVKGKLGRTRD